MYTCIYLRKHTHTHSYGPIDFTLHGGKVYTSDGATLIMLKRSENTHMHTHNHAHTHTHTHTHTNTHTHS